MLGGELAQRLTAEQRGVAVRDEDRARSPPPTASIATRTAWPVPSWSSWTASTTSGSSPADVRGDLLALVADDRRRSAAAPVARAAASTWPIMVRPAIGCSTFIVLDFIRVPPPAARTITVSPGGHCPAAHAPRVGVEPTSLVLIQSQAGPAGRPTGDCSCSPQATGVMPSHAAHGSFPGTRPRPDWPAASLERRGPARDAARAADARQVGQGHPRPGKVRRPELRAQVGRVPLPGVQGRRRGRARQPQHQAADPLLPRGRRGDARAAARPLRARRRALRGRHRTASGWSSRCSRSGSTRRSRASTCSAEKTPGVVRRLRPARAGRRVVRRAAVRRAPGRAARRRSATSTARATSPAPPPTRPRPRSGSSQFEGAGLDGVVAKPLGAPYQENARTMLKIKHERTADVVVAGYREHKTSTPERPLLGSLLLGLYDDGKLQHVGVSASFTEKRRAELIEELQPLVVPDRGAPVGRVAGVPHRQPRPGARHPEPLEPGQGPVLHAAAARAGAGGRLRPHGGPAVPPHRASSGAGAPTATRSPAAQSLPSFLHDFSAMNF